jgi:hypothetical protein
LPWGGLIQRGGSKFRGLFQDFFLFDVPVEINGAPGTRALTQRVPIFPHFVARTPGNLESRTFFLVRAIKDVPAGGEHHQIAQAGQGEAPLMDQTVDLIDLGDIEGGIKPVVGIFFPQGFNEPFFFILPDTFLGKVYQAGDLVDQEEFHSLFGASDSFVLSPGHGEFYKKISLNKFYIERCNLQEKSCPNRKIKIK